MGDWIRFCAGYGLARLLSNHFGEEFAWFGSLILGLTLLVYAVAWTVKHVRLTVKPSR